jgi:phospholipase/carboxylesterase
MSAGALTHLTRSQAAPGGADGLLVLFHGRGADERDLFPLLDVLDPEKRLLGVTPRGPLSLPPGGAHWYAVKEIGFPDAATFTATFARASDWLDEVVEATGLPWERVILGGFSQGAVMSYALGLGASRPRPAGLVALSGFIPTVPGFELDLSLPLPRVAIGHGALDPVISVEWGRQARAVLADAGADLVYRETPGMSHSIDPRLLGELRTWIDETIGEAA